MSHLIESASADEVPKLRKGNPQSSGRARKTTEFDAVLEPCYNQGWQKVQVTDEDDLAQVLKDLRKSATDFGYGMDRITSDDRTLVYFRVRDRHPQRKSSRDDSADDDEETQGQPEFDLSAH